MYEQSHRDYLRLVICIIVCLPRLLIITVITPLPTKPSDKNARELAGESRQLLTCRCVSVMLQLDAKYTKELADAKVENDALRDDALVVVGCTSKAVCQSVREATTASGVDNAASPRLADTAERDYFTLRERLITMQKQLEGTQKYINEQCRGRVAHIDGQLMQLLRAHTRFQREHKCFVNKPSNPFTNVCWVSVLTTFSAPPQILAASTVFFCPP